MKQKQKQEDRKDHKTGMEMFYLHEENSTIQDMEIFPLTRKKRNNQTKKIYIKQHNMTN